MLEEMASLILTSGCKPSEALKVLIILANPLLKKDLKSFLKLNKSNP